MKNIDFQVPAITWSDLAIAVGIREGSRITIELREQSPPAHHRMAGSFRVTAGLSSMSLYDCAGMDEFRAQAAFDANIKLAQRQGYLVTTWYFDRP